MGLDRVLSRLESNENTFISLSNQYGQDGLRLQEKERKANLDSISDFSQTLSEHLVREKQEENKRLEDEGTIIAIEEDMKKTEEGELGKMIRKQKNMKRKQGFLVN